MTLKEKQQSTHKQCDRRVFCTTAHSRASVYRMLRTLLHIYRIYSGKVRYPLIELAEPKLYTI